MALLVPRRFLCWRSRFVAGHSRNLARILCGPTRLVARIFSIYGRTGLVPWHALNTSSAVWCSGCLRYSRWHSNQSDGNNQRSHSPHKFPPNPAAHLRPNAAAMAMFPSHLREEPLAALFLAQQLGQLCDVVSDPPRFVGLRARSYLKEFGQSP